ncbi:HD-GYP domain-containing protein [Brucepastera parasyntrophica]|uniref:HD-GYP domain-containing protein n=1 Tax=Brucepastera parasyntrophica TaxID=2880008 RepID=UPI0021096E56|nr:HD-GYP domain-containing protein [Brucepastera parasyntrophica]ULQ59408.1 HD-GYP domain-containing protein [Brucepastera parasyntrophica]
MNSFDIKELEDNTILSHDLLLDKKFILLPAEVPVSEKLKSALGEWAFETAYSEGEAVSAAEETQAEISEEELNKTAAAVSAPPEPEIPVQGETDKSKLSAVEKAYEDYQDFIAGVYNCYIKTQKIPFQLISDRVRDMCNFIKENKSFVLRVQPTQEIRDKHFLVIHAMRSTVYAITIGLQLRFPIHKLIELGITSILHEIGMVHLPSHLYTGNAPLSQTDKAAILNHPIISYNILRQFSFPLNICLGVLEHHERENGAGYPRGLTKDKISIYAKIIAVACSYEAATAPRPYKEARDAYSGIIDIMKNQGKQYDETVIKALLFSLSLYPIGIYVLLSNNKIGQVIDVNPENPKYPVVQLHGETKTDGSPRVVETSEYAIHIARPLTKEETTQYIT